MSNLLLKYMNERLEKPVTSHAEPGPVITISRECGCQGSLIAQMVTEKINNKIKESGKRYEWRWVNKEILNLASQELKIHPEKVKQMMASDDYSLIQEIVASFTDKYYINNNKVRKVIRDVIRNIAVEGNAVIVGRGSSGIAADIPKALHIKLVAPLSWKTVIISRRKNISFDDARNYVLKIDEQRAKFRDYFKGKEEDQVNFHLTFNCATMSSEEICELIIRTAEMKQII